MKSVPLTVKHIKVTDALVTGKQLWTSGHSPLLSDLTWCLIGTFNDRVTVM